MHRSCHGLNHSNHRCRAGKRDSRGPKSTLSDRASERQSVHEPVPPEIKLGEPEPSKQHPPQVEEASIAHVEIGSSQTEVLAERPSPSDITNTQEPQENDSAQSTDKSNQLDLSRGQE